MDEGVAVDGGLAGDRAGGGADLVGEVDGGVEGAGGDEGGAEAVEGVEFVDDDGFEGVSDGLDDRLQISKELEEKWRGWGGVR